MKQMKPMMKKMPQHSKPMPEKKMPPKPMGNDMAALHKKICGK